MTTILIWMSGFFIGGFTGWLAYGIFSRARAEFRVRVLTAQLSTMQWQARDAAEELALERQRFAVERLRFREAIAQLWARRGRKDEAWPS